MATEDKPKFTPGPWTTRLSQDGSGDIGITALNVRNVIAECFADMREAGEFAIAEVQANAALIAAAPDMYEALKMAQLWLDIDGRYDMRIINAAINKAEGRQP